MEEDGFLVNFTVDSDVIPKKSNTKVVGGKWKDRRKAQLSAQGRGRSSKSEANQTKITPRSTQTSGTTPSTRSTDKKETNKRRTTDNNLGPTSKQVKFSESRGENGGKGNSFVSSLFTSKPEISTQTSETPMELLAPSNAPLSDATSFDGLGIESVLFNHLNDHLKFKNPTKIQRSVLPRLLTRERDLFVQAQTGSGKTLAFCLPIFQKLMEIKDLTRTTGIFALILTPTRELATQIYGVLETLTRCCHRIVPGIVIGGEKKKSEKARLRKGVNILVATPGRLADHIENTETLDLSNIRWVVLDEGDKLMELGFEETISTILSKIEKESRIDTSRKLYPTLPNKRVNVLCSATIKGNVKKLGELSLKDAEMVSNSSVPEGTIEFEDNQEIKILAPDQLVQQVLVVPPKLRLVTLGAVLKNITKVTTSGSRTMVFLSCSDSVDFHFSAFTKEGKQFKKVTDDEGNTTTKMVFSDDNSTVLTAPLLGSNVVVYKLHGSLSQQTRTSTLSAFTKSAEEKHTIIFCTDVASRGLDLPHISTVVEYDPPFALDDHLHRVGRTARAGMSGTSILFLLPGLEETYAAFVKQYHPSGLQNMSYEDILKSGFGNKWDVDATTWHLDVERWLLEDSGAHSKAVQGFTSHVRAYATHLSSEREFFNVKLLHLGHLAKSFGLRETPKKLGRSVGNSRDKDGHISESSKRGKEDPRKKMLRMASMAVKSSSSEFNY